MRLRISQEVKQALHERKPIVSLESTIITHGFPRPANLVMARSVEHIIRKNGAIPATCAFIDGVPHVGLTSLELTQLADLSRANKVSRRDIGATMASKQNGGTTIAATMILSHMAGIDVFATGGLGGVHRDGHITMDVSADLTELSRTPVSVVCAGPKSILDVQRTMEFLETHGVFVGVYNDNNSPSMDIPGFFTRDSGVKAEYTFQNWEQAASIAYSHNNTMGLLSACLFCVPPPVESALPSDKINEIIDRATFDALKAGIAGKALTPFLLKRVGEETDGKLVECNKNFMLNNAKSAVSLAKELRKLEKEANPESATFIHPVLNQEKTPSTSTLIDETERVTSPESNINTVFVGLVALDTISTLSTPTALGDSNPGVSRCSVGGVASNMALAAHYMRNSSSSSRLISVLGDDLPGKMILDAFSKKGRDTSGLIVEKSISTAQYSAILDQNGQLVVAVADMSGLEQRQVAEKITENIIKAQPRTIIMDCNLSGEVMDEILSKSRKELFQEPQIIMEPTSLHKAARIALINSKNLRVFPNNSILLITPTTAELDKIHESLGSREFFDDYDEWFPALDSLGINSQFREMVAAKANKCPVLKELLENGVLQQSFHVLPYIPNILVKLGQKGVLLVRLCTNIDMLDKKATETDNGPKWQFHSTGAVVDEDKKVGVVITYFPVPEERTPVNVTGAGDTLLGVLSGDFNKFSWLNNGEILPQEEQLLFKSITKAQRAAGYSVESPEAVADTIKMLD